MGGDLIDHHVGVDDPADEFSAGPRRPDALKDEFAAVTGRYRRGFKQGLHRPDGLARRLGVKADQDIVVSVDQDRFRAGRTDIDPAINRFGLFQGQINIDFDSGEIVAWLVEITFPGCQIRGISIHSASAADMRNVFPFVPYVKRSSQLLQDEALRRPFFPIKQGGADGPIEMTVFPDDRFDLQQAAEMLDHRLVHGHAAGQDQRRTDLLVRHQGVDDVFGQAFAETVADLGDGISLLLGMNQVRFGENGAAGGDFGGAFLVAEGDGAERFRCF